MMLGHSERESGAHALVAASIGGWAPDCEPLLDLGSMTATLSTVANLAGLAGVVHLGHPAQPSHELERALLGGPTSLVLTAAVAVSAEWVWVGRSTDSTGSVVIDEAGMRDRRHILRGMGASPRLVPTRTTLAERIAVAGETGSLVLERSRVPAGWVELPGSSRLTAGAPVWYGLVESRTRAPEVTGVGQVWLAFGPGKDHRGSLQETLGLFADSGVDLQHLRSHRSVAGPHFFFTAFSCDSAAALAQLTGTLGSRGVAHRVLAVLPGGDFPVGPEALDPQWAST